MNKTKKSQLDHRVEVRNVWKYVQKDDEKMLHWWNFCHNFQGVPWTVEEPCWLVLEKLHFGIVWGSLRTWCIYCGNQARVEPRYEADMRREFQKIKMLVTIFSWNVKSFPKVFKGWDHGKPQMKRLKLFKWTFQRKKKFTGVKS